MTQLISKNNKVVERRYKYFFPKPFIRINNASYSHQVLQGLSCKYNNFINARCLSNQVEKTCGFLQTYQNMNSKYLYHFRWRTTSSMPYLLRYGILYGIWCTVQQRRSSIDFLMLHFGTNQPWFEIFFFGPAVFGGQPFSFIVKM